MPPTSWDEDDPHHRPPPVPSSTQEVHSLDIEADLPRPRSRALPWLVAVLFAVGWAATSGRLLHEREELRAALASARDEASEYRHNFFRAEDNLAAEKQARLDESSRLQKTVTEHGAQKAATEKLISDLRAQLDSKTGEVSSEANQIAVNLVDQILFKSGDADLSAPGKQVLDRVGKVLKGLTDKQILIGGHTDSRPIHTERFPSNWELSAARAVNVARYLAETVGVDPAKVAATGFSQFHPRGRSLAKNRRIEILLTPMVLAR